MKRLILIVALVIALQGIAFATPINYAAEKEKIQQEAEGLIKQKAQLEQTIININNRLFELNGQMKLLTELEQKEKPKEEKK